MTKKHFEALAKALKDSKPFGVPGGSTQGINQWVEDCKIVGAVCCRFNPNLDYIQFLEDCGARLNDSIPTTLSVLVVAANP